MRTLKQTLMVAFAFALAATTASASSVDVIWQVSGTGTTTVSASATITGDIVMSIGLGDLGLGGAPAGDSYQLAVDSPIGIDQLAVASTPPASWFSLGLPILGTQYTANAAFAGDFLGIPGVFPGGSITIGTVTVHATVSGQVLASPNGGGYGVFKAGGVDITSQFTFGGGNIIVPEPTTASLLGLGLIGLTVAGRQRKS